MSAMLPTNTQRRIPTPSERSDTLKASTMANILIHELEGKISFAKEVRNPVRGNPTDRDMATRIRCYQSTIEAIKKTAETLSIPINPSS